MSRAVQAKKDEVADLCRRFGVKRLELFGSAARQDFDADNSDLDFLVLFDTAMPGHYADRFFGLLESLEALFDRHVDLLELPAIKNPYFLREIQSARSLLYAA